MGYFSFFILGVIPLLLGYFVVKRGNFYSKVIDKPVINSNSIVAVTAEAVESFHFEKTNSVSVEKNNNEKDKVDNSIV